jgi:hypothetical protein
MSSDGSPPPVGPPYYNRLPSCFTPLLFRNHAYWVKLDFVDWVEANKEHIKLPPPKDKVNAYIVYYLQVTRFVDKRFPSVIFLDAFGSEVVTTEDPPTTPRFDRLRKESAALSAIMRVCTCSVAHIPNMNHRRNCLTNFKKIAMAPADLEDDYLRDVFDNLVQQLMKTGINSIENAIHVLKKGDSYQFMRNCHAHIDDPVVVWLLNDLGI